MGNSLFSKANSVASFASPIGQDRIIRKEVSLGFVREIEPPKDHIGLQFAPFLEVAADDVIFNYVSGDVDGLAPARAEDAESELAQKDDRVLTEGRASIIDWSLKDHYDASDVNRYRELLRIWEQLQSGSVPLTITSAMEDFAAKVTRDAARRRRKLDNRHEWMVMSALATNQIAYNDGRIKWTVPFNRPSSQEAGNAANDLGAFVTDGVYNASGTTHDPIGFYNAVKDFMYDKYGVVIDRVLCSRKYTRTVINSDKFSQRAGLGAAYNGSNQPVAPDLRYLLDGWGPDAALQVLENATDITHIVYDSVYRTRPIGSTTVTNNRFFPVGELVFLASDQSVGDIDDTEIGFGKTLTSPHPEGDWTPGYYEWEQSTKDPWGQDVGTGIKMFPVFPHLDLTYAVNVTLPS